MTTVSNWVEIVAPLPIAAARQAFNEWKAQHPAASALTMDDIRIDLIRTTTGDQQRYLVRKEVWRLFQNR